MFDIRLGRGAKRFFIRRELFGAGRIRREINPRLSAWKSAEADSVGAVSPQDFHVLRSRFIRDG